MAEFTLTRAEYEELKRQLEQLENIERQKVAREIAAARAQGDLSENAAYIGAKEKQAFLESKIRQLRQRLREARIIDEEPLTEDKVTLGSLVRLKDLQTGEEAIYKLVSGLSFEEGSISAAAPLGKALLGKAVGEVVEIQAPAGTLRYEILEIPPRESP